MRSTLARPAWSLALAVVVLCGCPSEDPFPSDDELLHLQGLLHQLTPQPLAANALRKDARAVELGQALFEDPGLSSCGTLSCATCHPAPSYAGNTPLAQGCNGLTARNTPTLLNAGFRDWFYWDGRKDSLWSHAILPLTRDVEMNATPASLRAHVSEFYGSQYAALFGTSPSEESDDLLLSHFGKTLDAYMSTLVKVRAPFDDALQDFTAQAAAGQDVSKHPLYLGLKTFARKGRCIACHKGPNFTDELFHNLGVDDNGTQDPGRASGIDIVLADKFNGAGAFSENPRDTKPRIDALATANRTELLGAFKTPSLRNVALTAPYMHTGRFRSLAEVVDFYNRGGDPQGTFVGTRTDTIQKLDLSDAEKQALVQLLEQLTGSENP